MKTTVAALMLALTISAQGATPEWYTYSAEDADFGYGSSTDSITACYQGFADLRKKQSLQVSSKETLYQDTNGAHEYRNIVVAKVSNDQSPFDIAKLYFDKDDQMYYCKVKANNETLEERVDKAIDSYETPRPMKGKYSPLNTSELGRMLEKKIGYMPEMVLTESNNIHIVGVHKDLKLRNDFEKVIGDVYNTQVSITLDKDSYSNFEPLTIKVEKQFDNGFVNVFCVSNGLVWKVRPNMVFKHSYSLPDKKEEFDYYATNSQKRPLKEMYVVVVTDQSIDDKKFFRYSDLLKLMKDYPSASTTVTIGSKMYEHMRDPRIRAN